MKKLMITTLATLALSGCGTPATPLPGVSPLIDHAGGNIIATGGGNVLVDGRRLPV